jgi:RING-box protein 1
MEEGKDSGAVVESTVTEGKIDGDSRPSTSGGAAVRFEIKKWNAVAMWSWDICADTCAICRNSLNEPSIEYQVK